MARHWHFLSVLFWVGNGLVFVVLLFGTGQWRRLVPTSWQIVPDAWAVFVHYATLHLPPEPNGFYHYNALQQLAYFGVVFVLAPLAILTGPSMSPALTNRFTWYPFLPGNRQIGRSIHFLVMCTFVVFLVGHVAMITMTGLVRNMNHIVRGTDDTNPAGLYLGLAGIAVVVVANALANWMAWKRPRAVQHAAARIVTPVMRFVLDRPAPVAQFSPRGHLSVLLDQRQDADLRRVEEAGRRTNSRTTGSRSTVWSRTRSSCRWMSSGRSARRPRSRCTTASRAGRASPSGADCRWRN